ncbi:MAG TPA: helix-turn-helix transcriptional regulator [Rhodothermales bacterium]|nr:helix-turn-helix transcriptional regulator [Rhodothermales bacterium]
MPEVSRSLVAASSRPLILAILSELQESYGYEIIQEVKRLSGGVLEWQDGMLYPVLHRLEEEGLIASRWGVAENGRKRKYYRLNPSGLEALKAEMAQWVQVHQTLMSVWNPNLRPT